MFPNSFPTFHRQLNHFASSKQGVEWHWDNNQQKAFDEVKILITCHPALQHYDVTKEVTLQCDASQSGVGAALLQEGHPVAFTSRALTSTERNYAQMEKELLAIVHACDRFDQYVFGREITVETDHNPLDGQTRKAKYYREQELTINSTTNCQYKVAFFSKANELLC